MRVRLAVGVALLASAGLGGSAVAQETTWDGYASVGAGGAWYSTPYFNATNWLAEGRGSAEFSLAGNWGTQFDVVGTHQALGEPGGANYDSIDLATHVFYRQPGHWLFGPLFQYRTSTWSNGGFANNFGQYFVGAEAQGYAGKFSLYGQVAYQDSDLGFETDTGWVARARARFFFTPDWFVEANAMHSVLNRVDSSFGSTEDTFGAGTEYHLSGTPLGVFARYSYSDVRFSGGGGNYNVSRIVGGFKWSFGGDSLWDRETGGASLDPLPPPYMPRLPPA